jgi:hypothetical protein
MSVDEVVVRIYLEGHADDLYALSLLFSAGAHPDFQVHTVITGEKDGLFDRVVNAEKSETYVTGNGCLALAESHADAEWTAQEIIAPLNGYAVLADSNFQPVCPKSVSVTGLGGGSETSFGLRPRPSGMITVNRHPFIQACLPSRVGFMAQNRLAASAANVIAGIPSWAEYYRILEDIAGHLGTTLDKLPEADVADRTALNAFKAAANNRATGRHGASKRNTSIPQADLMNLLEAREFVRRVVTAWLDRECGGRMPRDRVDGGKLRFGLDDNSTSSPT